MFTKEDVAQIKGRGVDLCQVEAQVERFKKGFPWMKIVAPATPGRGIKVLSAEDAKESVDYYCRASVEGKCKFVPASGAASRMFKDMFSGLAKLEAGEDLPAEAPGAKLAARIKDFAFYDEKLFGEPEDSREYMRDTDPFTEEDTCNLVITISPEHRDLFEKAVAEVVPEYEKRYGVHYDITFTYQDKATDTIAVDMNNEPFRTEDGKLLFRPAGHGALIYNLEKVDAELVSIKNIDNVAHEKLLGTTSFYKQVLMGEALRLRDWIILYIRRLNADPSEENCSEIEEFLDNVLCVKIPKVSDLKAKADLLRSKLNRPIRVCGMVRNEGEPGGGPYIVEGKDGCTSLQILESVQINKDDPHAVEAMSKATHFNPVDLVCLLRDCRGNKFDLLSHVDQDAGFISSKSYQGRELKALELPGLWNGAMSDWNTMFVEVPLETFNPVKVVLDLLRPAHQG